MPILIDNFQVNTNAPIDNRFVVGPGLFYLTKDDINYKYVGLRVWDSNVDLPFYWDGTQWLSENSVGVLADTNSLLAGESGYITKFTSGPTVVGKSLIFENQTTKQLGIGLTGSNINANFNSTPVQFGLHVAGNIKTNNYFIGNGLYVTDINASNVNSGLLKIQYISPNQIPSLSAVAPGINYVLFNNGSGVVSWRDTNNLSVLNSTNTTNVNVVSETLPTIHYITFAQGTGNVPIKINSSKMQFRPDNGQLFLSDGSLSAPVYSFLSGSNTGFYYNYSGNGNVVPNTIPGIGTSIEGVEVTRTNRNGLVVNNRIYIQPTSNNLSDVGYGIVWLLGAATNDININDGFNYQGGTNYNTTTQQFDAPNYTTQRLNYYGIGSHIPNNSNTPSSLAGRGTYIAGYFGVDIFSGNRLKLKVDEYNDVTINSRLNIYNSETLGNSINTNIVLSTIQNSGGSAGNNVVIKDWSVRASQALTPNSGSQDSWLTWKHHNGITIDGFYNTPNGPAKLSGPDLASYGTLTFWERHPYLHEQYFGSADRKTLTINSSVNNTGSLTSFVKVDGNILVGGSTTQITNSTGNVVIGNGNLLVGTNTIIPSAMVDFTSTTKGILLPRMTTTQRGNISLPAEGLTIYNSTKKSLDTYDGTNWISNIKVKVVELTTWLKDRKYTVTHGITGEILSCRIDMRCVITDGNYLPGDITQAQSGGEDQDGSSDYDYGIGVQYRLTGTTTCYVLIGDRIYLRRGFATPGTNNNAININPANWVIRIVFFHT